MPRLAPLIFVSSTTEDLSEYRDAIIRSFPHIDALYRGMEFFGARPERPKRTIQLELAECDLYVGIVAHRYGSLDESGISFTEFEYQFAKKHGKPRLVFLHDPKHPAPAIFQDENAASFKKLRRFKGELITDQVVKFFTTPDDFVAKLLDSLRQWIAENEVRWRAMKQIPLLDRENQHIRELYSNDQEIVLRAIGQLARPDCRSALEHFYALLNALQPSTKMVEAVFKGMQYFIDEVRVSQILLNLIDDRAELRVKAIECINFRSIAQNGCADASLDRILKLSTHEDPDIRFAVAHALQNIGVNRKDRIEECRACLTRMETCDAEPKVKDRAALSLSQKWPPSRHF